MTGNNGIFYYCSPSRGRSPAGGVIEAWEADAGQRLWSTPLHSIEEWPNGMVANDDSLFVAYGDIIYVLDNATGAMRWSNNDNGGASGGGPFLTSAASGEQIIVLPNQDRNGQSSLRAINATSGEISG